ncbi:cyclase family protein [soil metagenome]
MISEPAPGRIHDQVVRIYDLEQPRFQGMPIHESHQPGYLYVLHRRHADSLDAPGGPRSGASGMIVSMEHAGTHIDALCHQAENQTVFGGINAASICGGSGFTRHGVEEIAPIAARGVLLDIAGHRGTGMLANGDVVGLDEVKACIESQGVTIEPGDVVLVRTGNGRNWNDPAAYLPGPGMDGAVSLWLAEQRGLAVGADNMAWDVIGLHDSDAGCELPGHLYLLVRSGIYIIENLNLEALAADRQWSFSFICTPLKFNGATGSPVRPIAICPA